MSRSNKSIADKYEELKEAGYIVHVHVPDALEMPTALVYVPTYVSDGAGRYDWDTSLGGARGELDRHSK